MDYEYKQIVHAEKRFTTEEGGLADSSHQLSFDKELRQEGTSYRRSILRTTIQYGYKFRLMKKQISKMKKQLKIAKPEHSKRMQTQVVRRNIVYLLRKVS